MGDNAILLAILGALTTLFTVAGMQFKNMNVILITQIISNSLLMSQYIIEGGFSAGGVVIVAIVQTVISFVLTRKGIDFPVWLTAIFMVAFLVVTVIYYKGPLDILTCVAVWCFALAIIQKNSRICRAFSVANVTLWLIYDFGSASYSAAVTHIVVIAFLIVGICRLDLKEWGEVFAKLFKKDAKTQNAVSDSNNQTNA